MRAPTACWAGAALLACATTASGAEAYRVAEAPGTVRELRDVNGDGDALDAGERRLWADGFADLADLAALGDAVYAVEAGQPDGANGVVRLLDVNGDGDALDAGERSAWAGGLDEPRGLVMVDARTGFVAEFELGEIWRLHDGNEDGDALDAGERARFAAGISAPFALARTGDVLWVSALSDGAVHRVRDLNGDGDALDAGENVVVAAAIDAASGVLPDGSGGLFVAAQAGDTVFHAIDGNGDGDMLDLAEVLSYADAVFGAIDGPQGMLMLPGGGFLLTERLDGEVARVHDVNGDGDALDVGEVVPYAAGLAAPVAVVAVPQAAGDATGVVEVPLPAAALGALGVLSALAGTARSARRAQKRNSRLSTPSS